MHREAFQQSICQLWKLNKIFHIKLHYVKEYLLIIAAPERVNTATATMMIIRIKLSEIKR